MQIENRFTVAAPIDAAWALLTDVPAIAPCLPGATLDDETDGVFAGSVKVKVGPVTAQYKGTAEFRERDDAARRAVISASGRDTRGAGTAEALITASLVEVDGATTQVDIRTELKVTGKVAQFGRGVMQDVSEKLLGQFAECLAGKLDTPATDETAGDDGGDATATRAAPPTATDEPLDLLEVAGGAMAKRLVPVVVAVILVVLVLRSRRRRRG